MDSQLGIVDVYALEIIEQNHPRPYDAIMEKINASFFDVANIIGKLNKNSLINYEEPSVGMAKITLTPAGVQFLENVRNHGDFDKTDRNLLAKLSEAETSDAYLSASLGLDLEKALPHLYFLIEKGFADVHLRGDRTKLSITDSGLKMLKPEKPKQPEKTQSKKQPKKKKEKKQESKVDIPEIQPVEPAISFDSATLFKSKLNYYLSDPNFLVKCAIAILLLLIAIKLYVM